jgi:hypothetical protein
MITHPINPVRSEKGVALIIVLLLLAVMAGLTTGLTLNGQTEIAMASNELYYAGARAAAEAGMNRAVEQIIGDTATDLLATPTVPNIGNGPFDLNEQYSYEYEILDDDNNLLYPALPLGLSDEQLDQMGENGDPAVNANTRMILRSIGRGPKGTTVTLARVLSSTEIPDLPGLDTMLSNPAILVNGNLDMNGNDRVLGSRGNIHANGNITGTSGTVTGDITATGTVADSLDPIGLKAGGMPPISVPEIKASDFIGLADWIMTPAGAILRASDSVPCGGAGPVCPAGWNFTLATNTWSRSGSMPPTATYYVQGNAEIHGTGGSSMTPVSIITEGNLKITGNGKFRPENGAGIQFVTNGDFELGGTVDADDSVDMDGQIMVREQMKIYGNSKFQGRVMVEDREHGDNIYNAITNPNGSRGGDVLTANTLSGNMQVTYNGGLGDIVTEIVIPPGPSTYTNNISGWIEQ